MDSAKSKTLIHLRLTSTSDSKVTSETTLVNHDPNSEPGCCNKFETFTQTMTC